MALGNGALSIHQVSSYIGAGTLDLGTLCKFAGINKWALCKPVRYNTPDEFTNFALVNYGLVPPQKETIGSNIIQGVLSGPTTYPAWVYNKPRGLATYNEWYRLLDFNGYDHNAPCWFSFTNIGSTTTIQESDTSVDTVNLGYSLSNMSRLSGYSSYSNVGVLVAQYNGTTIVPSSVMYQRLGSISGSSGILKYGCFAAGSYGTYLILPVLTTYSGGSSPISAQALSLSCILFENSTFTVTTSAPPVVWISVPVLDYTFATEAEALAQWQTGALFEDGGADTLYQYRGTIATYTDKYFDTQTASSSYYADAGFYLISIDDGGTTVQINYLQMSANGVGTYKLFEYDVEK